MEDRIIEYTADKGNVELINFDEASSTVKVSVLTSIVNQGQAVAKGGKKGQVYTKKSDNDYDASWEDNLATGVEGIKGVAEDNYSQGFYEIIPSKIGLGNVDNTSDLDKPISNAQKTVNAGFENNFKQLDSDIDTLGKGLNERIDATNSNLTALRESTESALSNQQESINDVDSTLNLHIANQSNPHNVTKAQVGLDKVDNTADINKPISTAQANALQALQNNVNTQINDIKTIIPNQASADNQLADKNFVNSSVQNMAAFYITKDAERNPFDTHAQLVTGPYYFQGNIQTPSINDYAIVLQDETKTKDALGQYPTTRYTYDGTQWGFQYIVNNTPLTSEQVAAINSGATKAIIEKAKNATHLQDIATFSIATGDWVALDNAKPFKFKATKTINSVVTLADNAPVFVSFDDIVASNGIVAQSVTGTSVLTAIFYAVAVPSSTVTGTIGGTV